MNENNLNNENQNTIPNVNDNLQSLNQPQEVNLGVPQETQAVMNDNSTIVNPPETNQIQQSLVVEPVISTPSDSTNPIVSEQNTTPSTQTPPQNLDTNINTNNQEIKNNPKKSNKMIIIGAAIVLIALIVVIYFVFIKDSKNNDTNDDQIIDRTKEIEEATKKAEELDNNVSVVLLDKLSSRNFAVEIENKNQVAVGVEINIIFYDLNGNIIDKADVYSFLEKNSKWYESIYSVSEIKNYAKAEIKKKVTSFNVSSVSSSVEAKLIQGTNGAVYAQLTNKSDKIISDAAISVLFYYQNKIVGVQIVDFMNIRGNTTETDDVNIPFDDNYDEIKYDKVEIASIFAYNI